jgi:integrase/recombinase XerD
VLAYLRECRPRKGGPLFLSVRGRPLTRSTLENLVWEAGRRAALARLASPHRLRHSFATHLLRDGADIQHIQLLMGHSSLSSTQVYLGIETKDLERMIERSHPRERVG